MKAPGPTVVALDQVIGRSDPSQMRTVAPGIQRQLLSHGPALMLCRLHFESGAAGDLHRHPHSQISYVESGRFEVQIDLQTLELGPGDSCYIGPELDHAARCLQAGVLIDVFNPTRSDFLAEEATP